MGHPRPDGDSLRAALTNPEWVGRMLGEFVKTINTPPVEIREESPPKEEEPKAETLSATAARLRDEALGRTPARFEAATRAETPAELEAAEEAGRRRAHARLVRIAERSIRSVDDANESH